MADNNPRIGLGFLAYKRPFISALSLAFYFRFRPENSSLHLYLDADKATGQCDPILTRLFVDLKDAGFAESVHLENDNRSLPYMVTKSTMQLAKSEKYDYVVRYEDDILIGPQCLQHMATALELSLQQKDDRPLALMAGQVTRNASVLRPIRFRRVEPYLVGIHGADNLEGLTMLRANLHHQGFDWRLNHKFAYNNEWLNQIRTLGYEGGCIAEPTLSMQHIGHRTTVPWGTPVAPAYCWNSQKIIPLPPFDWYEFYNNTVESEPTYILRIVRELATELPPVLSACLLRVWDPVATPVEAERDLYEAQYNPMRSLPAEGSVIMTQPPPVPPEPAPSVAPAVLSTVTGTPVPEPAQTSAAGWSDF